MTERRPNPKRLNLGNPHEVRFWCIVLGISAGALMDAARKVGPVARDIAAELTRSGDGRSTQPNA